MVNGRQFLTSRKLERALKRLRENNLLCCNLACSCRKTWYAAETDERYTCPETLMWVDSICINQKSDEERNSQVPLMAEIFGLASEVILWIGEGEGDENLEAIRFLHGLADLYDMEPSVARQLVSYIVREPGLRSSWLALGQFLAKEWWKRLWILQEIVLAQSAILVCGRFCAKWEHICKAWTTFRMCNEFIDEIMEATVLDSWSNYLWPFIRNQARFELPVLLRHFIKSQSERNVGETLRTLLLSAKNYSCTNPKDKVYGTLGILRALTAQTMIAVRYEEPVSYLFARTAMTIHDQTKRLHFLSMLERTDDCLPRNFGLPSWVPDFTIESARGFMIGDGQNINFWDWSTNARSRFSCSFTKNSDADCQFDLSRGIMTVKGFTVDTIETVGSRFYDLDTELTVKANKFTTRFCRRITWTKETTSEDVELFWRCRLRFDATEGLNDESYLSNKQFHDELSPNKLHSTVFRTKANKLLGIIDCAVNVGDKVCALFGADVPYILRLDGDFWKIRGPW